MEFPIEYMREARLKAYDAARVRLAEIYPEFLSESEKTFVESHCEECVNDVRKLNEWKEFKEREKREWQRVWEQYPWYIRPLVAAFAIPFASVFLALPVLISCLFEPRTIQLSIEQRGEKGMVAEYDQSMGEMMKQLEMGMKLKLERLRKTEPETASKIEQLIDERKKNQEESYAWKRSPKWSR